MSGPNPVAVGKQDVHFYECALARPKNYEFLYLEPDFIWKNAPEKNARRCGKQGDKSHRRAKQDFGGMVSYIKININITIETAYL